MDRYSCYRDLAAHPHAKKHIHILKVDRGTHIAILAPHGGGIEPGTSELSQAIAGVDFSLYCFDGIKNGSNQDLHITSVRFDEPDCLDLLRHTQTVVAVHGCAGRHGIVYVGGKAEDLKSRLIAGLTAAGFPAEPDNSHHAGTDPHNLCNRGLSGSGVQLEIDLGFRRRLFAGLSHAGRRFPTDEFRSFVQAIRQVLLV